MKQLKVGLVGAGNIANVHLASYKEIEEIEVVAICDINPAQLNATADAFGIARRYTSLGEMIAGESLDAVDICVWNCNHAKCAIEALEAGLHVLCEKPMAYNAEEAQAMKETADRVGKLLMIAFCVRFEEQTKVAKDFIDQGALGEIYFAKMNFIRRHGNPGGWFSDKSRSGGGPIVDLGVHFIDNTRYLMGNPKPVSVYAAAFQKLGNRKGLKTDVSWRPKDACEDDLCDVEDLGVALIRYDNGAVARLEASYSINGQDLCSQELFGTKGGFYMGDELKLYTEVNGYLADITPSIKNLKNGGNEYTAELRHFADCILNGTPCTASAEDGIAVMKILDAIYESARTGHEVLLK